MRVDVVVGHRPPRAAVVPADASIPIDGLLADLAAGRIVTLIPEHAVISVEYAADLLLASPAFVAGLIERGELPAVAAGANPRVRYADLMAYKRRNDAERAKALDELTQLSQEMGLY